MKNGLKQTPFTFTLKNNCKDYVKIYITIDSTYRTSTDTSYLKDSYMKVNVSPKDTTTNQSVILANQTLTDLESNRKGYIIVSTGLKANEEKSYDLRIWMDSAVTTEQGLNKSWAGKIVVVSNAANEETPAPNGWYEAKDGTLLASLRKNTSVTEPLTIPGAEPNAYTLDDAVTFTSDVSSFFQKYYITYGTGWTANENRFDLTGTAVTSDTYANSYADLVGKYLTSDAISVAGSSKAGEMKTTTKLATVYYVVSATASSFTYKPVSSNKNTNEAIVASTEDDYGTSYYYRGSVDNNYVQFANKCWRIVRVIGDGSIKLILHNDNTSNVANPCAAANNSTTAAFVHYNGSTYKSVFNSSYDDNTYVGFMYGTAGSSDYASTHANTNKSTILTNLETWYTNNLASYEDKIADTVWCSDKSIVTDTTFDPYGKNPTGLGCGTNNTYYTTMQRLVSTEDSYAGGTGPTLKCSGELSKIATKVGLLSADEIAFAGYVADLHNPTSFLQENASEGYWWSLSPSVFDNDYADVWFVNGYSGSLSYNYVGSNFVAVRPSISLEPSTNVTGDGTSSSPFIVS